MGGRRQEGVEVEEEIPNAVCAGFDLLNRNLKVRTLKNHLLQLLRSPCQENHNLIPNK